MEGDKDMPAGLKALVEDDELWALYRPTGAEVQRLRDIFGPLGNGDKDQYRDALTVVREFTG